jgi:hypothetical protein
LPKAKTASPTKVTAKYDASKAQAAKEKLA